MPNALNDFEIKRLEFNKRQGENNTTSLADRGYGPGRNDPGRVGQQQQQQRQTKLPNVITNVTEAHLGRMDTTLRGAVLGPNTGQSFNTGLR